jgi:uncharacterized protein (DUF2141 family)
MLIKILIGFLLQSIFFFITAFAQDSSEVNYGSLTVIIYGFENENGDCRFAIDNNEYLFESEDTVLIGKVLPIINHEVIIKIDSLSYGEYAVKVFHDENQNGELDTDFLGIPSEDYGYSNDASSWFGPPSWDKAKFTFHNREMTIKINID